VLFITHDRAFLQRLATRIIEIDRGKLVSWPGDYRDYLRRKAEAIEEEERHNAEFDRKLAEEEAWIRQGIKARRTRNEGRVRALMDAARATGRADQPTRHRAHRHRRGRGVRPQGHPGEERQLQLRRRGADQRPGSQDHARRPHRPGRQQRRRQEHAAALLLGELAPQTGTIKHGTQLEIAWFDQLRGGLDPALSVADNVGDGRDHVTINGKSRHVVGYLRGFLFSAKRALTPVASLSGGERNRVILAKLFTRPSNLLVLDEPTNDLDVETLEVLEARLAEYAGTLIVVSHDREFLDNVVNKILVFEAGGRIIEYAGGYSDWARRGRELAQMDDAGARRPGRDRRLPRKRDPPAPRSARRRPSSATRSSASWTGCRRGSRRWRRRLPRWRRARRRRSSMRSPGSRPSRCSTRWRRCMRSTTGLATAGWRWRSARRHWPLPAAADAGPKGKGPAKRPLSRSVQWTHAMSGHSLRGAYPRCARGR
jgi:ABC transport system ATP-binding/permease protein